MKFNDYIFNEIQDVDLNSEENEIFINNQREYLHFDKRGMNCPLIWYNSTN